MATSIRDKAADIGVDPDLAEAVMGVESSGNPNAVSPKGARGRMQVMPTTDAEVQAQTGEQDPDKRGLIYLKEQLDSHADKGVDQVPFALASYNAGPNRVKHVQSKVAARGADPNDYYNLSGLLPAETQDYVKKVFGRLRGPAVAHADSGPSDAEIAGMAAGPSDDEIAKLAAPEDLSAEAGIMPTPGEDVSVGGTLKRTLEPLGRGLKETFLDQPSRRQDQLQAILHDPETSFGTKAWETGKAALEGAGAVAAPEVSVPAKVIGASVVGAGGTKEQGETAETAAGMVGAVPALTRTVGKVASTIRNAPRLGQQLVSDLRAGRSLRDVGEELGNRYTGGRLAKGIGDVATEGSNKYLDAQDIADQAGLVGGDGTKVSDLIDTHSSMGERLSTLRPNSSAYRQAKGEYDRLGDRIRTLGAGNQDFLDTWDDARNFYRDVGAPTKRTLGRIAGQRSPEKIARAAVPPQEASEFEKLAAQSPEAADAAKSAWWRDRLEKASTGGSVEEGGTIDVQALSKSLDPKSVDPALMKHLASDPAAKTTIKALRHIAKIQQTAPVTAAAAAGATGGIMAGLGHPYLGTGTFFTSRKAIESALKSEKVANALYTIAKARQGTPGWQVAAGIVRDAATGGAIAARAPLAHAAEQPEEE